MAQPGRRRRSALGTQRSNCLGIDRFQTPRGIAHRCPPDQGKLRPPPNELGQLTARPARQPPTTHDAPAENTRPSRVRRQYPASWPGAMHRDPATAATTAVHDTGLRGVMRSAPHPGHMERPTLAGVAATCRAAGPTSSAGGPGRLMGHATPPRPSRLSMGRTWRAMRRSGCTDCSPWRVTTFHCAEMGALRFAVWEVATTWPRRDGRERALPFRDIPARSPAVAMADQAQSHGSGSYRVGLARAWRPPPAEAT